MCYLNKAFSFPARFGKSMMLASAVGIRLSFGSIKLGSLADHYNFQILRPLTLMPEMRKTMIGQTNACNSLARFLSAVSTVGKGKGKPFLSSNFSQCRLNSTFIEDPKIQVFLDYMEKLKNYEMVCVPKDAGTDSDDGFDLGRMRRLLQRLGNPHSHFKAVHVAGSKGKGSTTAFLSNILREEGYSVGCYTSPHLLTIRERISLGRMGALFQLNY